MIKKLCALCLAIILSGSYTTFAQENWIFTAEDKANTTQTQNNNDTYYGYAQTADKLYNYTTPSVIGESYYPNTYTPTTYTQNNYNPNTYTPTTYTPNNYNSNTYSASTSTTDNSAKSKESFSDRHPYLAIAGLSVLALGLGAVTYVLDSDSRDERLKGCQKNHSYKFCKERQHRYMQHYYR